MRHNPMCRTGYFCKQVFPDDCAGKRFSVTFGFITKPHIIIKQGAELLLSPYDFKAIYKRKPAMVSSHFKTHLVFI